MIRIVQLIQKFWKWLVGLVAAIVVGALGSSVSSAVDGWRFPWWLEWMKPPGEWIVDTWHRFSTHMTEEISGPRWHRDLPIGILGAVALAVLLLLLKNRRTHRSYAFDRFGDLYWRWGWAKEDAPGRGAPCRITPYCPNCDVKVKHVRGETDYSTGRTGPDHYACTKCPAKFEFTDPDLIKDEIEKVVRNKEWKKRMRAVK